MVGLRKRLDLSLQKKKKKTVPKDVKILPQEQQKHIQRIVLSTNEMTDQK